MTTNRTPAEWGRVAVSLTGWQWIEGMLPLDAGGHSMPRVCEYWEESSRTHDDPARGCVPDPDDPATAGCLLTPLGNNVDTCSCGDGVDVTLVDRDASGHGPNLGTACIAAAEACGRWPGGGQ